MSQSTQNIYKYIEYIKNNTKCQFIFVGDKYQCKSVDAYIGTWLISDYVLSLIDHNVIKLKWHKHSRYTKELYDKLEYIIKHFKNKPKVIKYVLKNFKTTTKSKTDINLTYYHNTGKQLKSYHTVHSHQGKTIDTKYTIHDIKRMSVDIIYTALSRAKKSSQIYIKI